MQVVGSFGSLSFVVQLLNTEKTPERLNGLDSHFVEKKSLRSGKNCFRGHHVVKQRVPGKLYGMSL